MKIQAIRNDSIALFTDIRELNSRGIDDGCITGDRTVKMIRAVFSELGITCHGTIDAQVYINGNNVLIFAQICAFPDVCELFCFSALEHLICACHALNSTPDATLISHDGRYYLAMHSQGENMDFHTVTEYGNAEPYPRLKYAFISEHGTTVCHSGAISLLRGKFHLNHSENPLFADSLPSWE